MSSPELLVARWCAAVERTLDGLLPPAETEPAALHQAMRYSIFAGGKRIRPTLCLAACRALGGAEEPALVPAAALEMMHTYTLIHDDLPCMDDDDLRRGRPTCHRVYGEDVAMLAGLGLMVGSLEAVAGMAGPPERRRALTAELARYSGGRGVVGGQVADLAAEGGQATPAVVERIHVLKTASLIQASLVIGGLMAGASARRVAGLRAAGQALGQSFQITDDVLGEIGSVADLGKPVGADRRRGKATYVRAVGLEAAQAHAVALSRKARRLLGGLPEDRGPLLHLVDLVATRRH